MSILEELITPELVCIKTVDGLRGIWSKASINSGDILFQLNEKNMIIGNSCKDVANRLCLSEGIDNPIIKAWYDNVPSTNDFPVFWEKGRANKRFQPLIDARIKQFNEESDHPDYYHWRTLVGSRNFNCGEGRETCIIPFADLFNHSENPNTKWFFRDNTFYIVANCHIGKHEQVFDTYGKKTGYYNMLYYNFIPKGSVYETRLCGHVITADYKSLKPLFDILRKQYSEINCLNFFELGFNELKADIKDDFLNEMSVVNYWLDTIKNAKKIIKKKKGWKKYKRNYYLSKVLPKLL